MKRLKLRASTSSRGAAIAAFTFLAVAASSSAAWAGKRVVVLDFDGPQAESFHNDVERIVKKAFVLVPVGKWNKAAEANEIERLSEKNVKMLCKKVGVDGVVSGKIEKRRDEYIVRLKLRECSSGEMVGNPIDVKATGPRLDGGASRSIREELGDAINAIASGGGGSDDDGDDTGDDDGGHKTNFGGKPKGNNDDGDDDPPPDTKTKKPKGKKPPVEDVDDDPPPDTKKPKGKKPPVQDDPVPDDVSNVDDDTPIEKPKTPKGKKPKAVAEDDGEVHEDGGDDAGDASSAANLSWGERAVDAKVGLSFLKRTLAFTSSLPAESAPAEYKGPASPAAYIDVTVFPLAIGHKRHGITKDIGLTIGFDRVLKLQSSVDFMDGNANKTAKVATTSQRFTIGAVFRHSFGKSETAPMVVAGVRYSSKKFELSSSGLPDKAIDLPNVAYSSVDPSLNIVYPINAKIAINVGGDIMLISKTGQIQNNDQFGPATVLGIEAEAGIDYRVTPKIFVHAGFMFSSISFKFKGQGEKTTMRDMDPDVDVTAAKDTYLGGIATAGFVY